jgi:glutathione S-transferase
VSEMILIGRNLSPFVRRVAITLKLLDLPFEQKPFSTATDAEQIRPFNPLLRVPALVLEDGETLIDSAAILDHIDEAVGPARALIPAFGPERRKVLRLLAIATGAMEKTVAAFYERSRRPPETLHPPTLKKLEDQAVAGFAALEREGESPWLALGRLTQADVTVAVGLDFLRTVLPHLLEGAPFPRLSELAARLDQLPPFATTRPSL